MTLVSLLLSLTLNQAPQLSPEQFVEKMTLAKRAGDLPGAARLADACVADHPASLPCYQEGGLVYLSLGAKTDSAAAHKKGIALLTTYVKLAPENDRFLVKAKSILAGEK